MKLDNTHSILKKLLIKEQTSIPVLAHKMGLSPQTIYRALQKKNICWNSQHKILAYHLLNSALS
ncbi:MAG TPA: helix-turn-helix domain-containing protein [Gammaproteobacteria bacterium]|nr:helix-turn-helix domain-containing protein [Gammaproteobacteria bacterium]